MTAREDPSRRRFLTRLLLGGTLAPLLMARASATPASAMPLLSPSDAAAKSLKYTPDASTAEDVPTGNKCANCALYEGSGGSTQGPCQVFPGKQVKAAGWCSSWAAQI
jgi:hypothetical protein